MIEAARRDEQVLRTAPLRLNVLLNVYFNFPRNSAKPFILQLQGDEVLTTHRPEKERVIRSRAYRCNHALRRLKQAHGVEREGWLSAAPLT